jgi:HAE1 family hydrophobic/amphiphilic exporter-1
VGQAHVGDVLYFPLARTVIGGLVSATLLTLVLVPTLYTVIEDAQTFLGRVWREGPRRGSVPAAAPLPGAAAGK